MGKPFERYNAFNRNDYDKPTKVRFFCRICFANIWEPKSILGSDPKYSVTCLIDKQDSKSLSMINDAIQIAKDDGVVKCWGGKQPTGRSFKEAIHDGDEDRPDDDAYAGQMYINASNKAAPDIVGRKMEKLTDPMMVGSGDYCLVTVVFYPFNADNTNKGVTALLQNVQLVLRGERLSGKSSAAVDFEVLPDFDDEDPMEGEMPDYLS